METTKKPLLSGLKAGDEVFVVEQKRRGGCAGYEPRRLTATVERVGRKYGYVRLNQWGDPAPFILDNGKSFHGEHTCATRSNGDGFDVYPSEQHYRDEVLACGEADRLSSRMVAGCQIGLLRQFPHECVVRLHQVLDDFGIE